MVSNLVSLNADAQPDFGVDGQLLSPWYALIQYATPLTGDSYKGEAFTTMKHAAVERLTKKVGAEPSECIIQVPVDVIEAEASRLFDHTVIQPLKGNDLTPFAPRIRDLLMFSKIRIFAAKDVKPVDMASSPDLRHARREFVGYVTDIQYVALTKKTTTCRIHCKDGRYLLKKTPFYGLLFNNLNPQNPPTSTLTDETVYIRDAKVIFNEGQQPNRRNDPKDRFVSEQLPRFINFNTNRFFESTADDDSGNVNFRMFVEDAATKDENLVNKLPFPFADKWLPGHAWNYIRNFMDSTKMEGAFKIYDIPTTDLVDRERMILQDEEIIVPTLMFIGNPVNTPELDMWKDWFVPRAVIGAKSQTGFGVATSGLGEFRADGQPVIEILFELCRRVGNYTLTAYYDEKDRMVLLPIRSVPGILEDKNVIVGLQGRLGGTNNGKKVTLRLPSVIDNERPNVPALNLWLKSGSYFNDFIMKGGTHWVTTTFSTLASQNYPDSLGQLHSAPNVPSGEYAPQLSTPTLIPGWLSDDQDNFLGEYLVRPKKTENFPDVFTKWLIPLEGEFAIDWKEFFEARFDTTSPGNDLGFRRFLERDRAFQQHLIISIFNITLGQYRSKRAKVPIVAMRAFRGIRTEAGGATAYGGPLTENKAGQSNPVRGHDDWFQIGGFKIINEGQLGIKFDSNNRLNKDFEFESFDPKPIGSGAGRSPLTWNGLDFPSVRSYEIQITITLALDEDVFEKISLPNTGTRSIRRFGPRMEMYREAGNEYGIEDAIHAVIPQFNPGSTDSNLLAVPPVDKNNSRKDAASRRYRDDRDEILARARMMANRHGAPDIEGEFHLNTVNLDLWPGDFVTELEIPGETNIQIKALVASVTHDFQAQRTSVNLASIR